MNDHQKKKFINPLRKFSLLQTSLQTEANCVPVEKNNVLLSNKKNEFEQKDIISLLPREITLKIFYLLSFQDLIQIQLTCKTWNRITQDVTIWRNRFYELNSHFTDIYAHKPLKWLDTSTLPWKKRYCQAITFVNWRMGNVQRTIKIDNNNHNRVLAVKLRNQLLVTLSEDNTVKLYEYSTEHGFILKSIWFFGDPAILQSNCIVECIDILPDINILVIAQRGSKCLFYDITKGSKHDPIQVLKGGSHPWFLPDSISVNQDYFALAGRKPSVIFVWNWRKGIKLLSRAFENQPHNVFLSGNNLITVNVDGLLHVFNMYDPLGDATITHYLNACSIPCIEYNNELSLVLAPHASRRIYHYRWNEYKSNDEDQEHLLSLSTNNTHHHLHSTAQLPSAMSHRQRLSKTLSSFLGLKIPSSTHHLFAHHSFNPSSQQPRSSTSTGTHLSKNTSKDFIRQCSIRRRRHSSYNDYGYACQLKTDQYIKQYYDNMANQNLLLPPLPNLSERPRLIHSIRTTPLESTAKEIVNIAIHGDRVATVNRRGDIALYALNGTTAARVTAHLGLSEQQEWMEDENDINSNREDDELSDGYDFVRSRLAMGPMGLIYGSKNGTLWWLDFGYRV